MGGEWAEQLLLIILSVCIEFFSFLVLKNSLIRDYENSFNMYTCHG